MAQQEQFQMKYTPTKQKLPDEFKLITSPANKREFDLYNELLGSPIEKRLFQEKIEGGYHLSEVSEISEQNYFRYENAYSESLQNQMNQQEPLSSINNSEVVMATPSKEIKGCHCEKSKCSKRYCDCFRAGKVCGDHCNCTGCQNVEFTQKHKKHLKQVQMTKSGKGGKQMRCNCKKSHCMKNYCQCHNLGKYCSEACNCIQCDNRFQIKSNYGRKRQQLPQVSIWQGQQKQNLLLN